MLLFVAVLLSFAERVGVIGFYCMKVLGQHEGIALRSLGEEGGLAQLARAPALHAGGHRFDSDILHNRRVVEGNKEMAKDRIG